MPADTAAARIRVVDLSRARPLLALDHRKLIVGASTIGTLAREAEFEAPDAALVRARWIPKRTVDWVYAADEILVKHGAVKGRGVYEKRHVARWRAQKLIRYMVELRVHERWELKEHTEQRAGGGWTWTVEYVGGRNGK